MSPKAKMPMGAGSAGRWIAALAALYDALVKMGFKPERAIEIVSSLAAETAGKIRGRTKGSREQADVGMEDVASAVGASRLEYRVLTLASPGGDAAAVAPLVARWENGRELEGWQTQELGAYLDTLAAAGWEVVAAFGGGSSGTVIVRRWSMGSAEG
jgi:hypothetical protein